VMNLKRNIRSCLDEPTKEAEKLEVQLQVLPVQTMRQV